MASGEMGVNPSVHVWELRTARCVGKFDRLHRGSIRMLRFVGGGELLVTVGEGRTSALVVVNINTREKVLSTYLL